MPVSPSARAGRLTAGLAWAAVAITVWSASLIMMRLGVTTSLAAWDIAALRFGVAAVLLLPVILRRGFGFDKLGISGLLLMVGGFGAPYIVMMAYALKTAPASAAGSLNPGVMAVCSVFLGWYFLGQRIGAARIAGIVLILGGAGLFAGLSGRPTSGHLILIVTGLMWAGYVLTVRRAGVPALHAAAIVAVGSAIVYLPFYATVLPHRIGQAPLGDILTQAAFHGVLVSTITIFAFNRSAELLGPVTGATLPALIPVVTLLLASVFLGEAAGLAEIATAALIAGGVALILGGGIPLGNLRAKAARKSLAARRSG